MKRILTTLFALSLAVPASAATLTIPAFAVAVNTATGISCTPVSSTLVAPVAAGTVLSNCTVNTAGWVGNVTQDNPALTTVITISPRAFNIIVGPTPLAVGNYPATTVTATP